MEWLKRTIHRIRYKIIKYKAKHHKDTTKHLMAYEFDLKGNLIKSYIWKL